MGPRIVVVILVSVLLSGCITTGGTTGAFCDPESGLEPFRPTKAERAALSDKTKQTMVIYNRFGADNCGWKP